ncbi:MAG: periplasmic protein [Thermodesulfobacteriota bacterium]|nr:MAG: periplasmic protein [Thermodesulfobacteriota bacterium]
MRFLNILILTALLFTLACASKDKYEPPTVRMVQPQQPEIVAEFQQRPGNPAVTPDGRMIVSMQPIDSPEIKVVEVLSDGTTRPFPNEKWATAVDEDGIGMQAVIGVVADTNGMVWMLDMGGDGQAPKLVGWDTNTDTLYKTIVFPESVSKPNSFHQDVAIDTERNMAYVADMTRGDLLGDSSPAILVIDIETEEVRRVLEGNPNFAPGTDPVVINGNTFATKTDEGVIPIFLGLNPITIDPENEWVYFGSINGTGLFRIQASALADSSLSDEQLSAMIEPYGEKRSSDGISVDSSGNVYITDIQNNAIGVANPEGYQILVQDNELLLWPDGLAFGPNGWLYATVNQLNLHPALNSGVDAGQPPYYLVRVRPLSPGQVGR